MMYNVLAIGTPILTSSNARLPGSCESGHVRATTGRRRRRRRSLTIALHRSRHGDELPIGSNNLPGRGRPVGTHAEPVDAGHRCLGALEAFAVTDGVLGVSPDLRQEAFEDGLHIFIPETSDSLVERDGEAFETPTHRPGVPDDGRDDGTHRRTAFPEDEVDEQHAATDSPAHVLLEDRALPVGGPLLLLEPRELVVVEMLQTVPAVPITLETVTINGHEAPDLPFVSQFAGDEGSVLGLHAHQGGDQDLVVAHRFPVGGTILCLLLLLQEAGEGELQLGRIEAGEVLGEGGNVDVFAHFLFFLFFSAGRASFFSRQETISMSQIFLLREEVIFVGKSHK